MIDTIIVGAGPAGLCAAKTILQCNPKAELAILEANTTVGGVWARENIYPTLKTNHYFGGLDFSDFAMPVAHGAQPEDHMPGIAVHEFLHAYAHKFDLIKRVRFDTRVLEITRLDTNDGWQLKVSSSDEQIIACKKLIIGMGVNNKPARPTLPGAKAFDATILHSAELGPHAQRLLGDSAVRKITVLGGGKSAYDAVNMASSAGREVDWIIRRSGKGPVWVFPLETQLGPIKAQRDTLASTRFMTFFSPCIWNDGFKWIRHFLHSTFIGKFITKLFWAQMHADTIKECGFNNHDSLKVLQPEESPFWYGTCAGSCKYLPNLHDRIREGRVRVHREDLSHLSRRMIHLANGHQITTDALITATGFSAKPSMTFLPRESHCDLGLPTTDLSLEQEKFWARLDLQSDIELGQKFPSLLKGPPNKDKSVLRTKGKAEYSPFRLYRSIAPPGLTARGDRSLVFLGVFNNFANPIRLEAQCLWAYAYLNNKLTIDSQTVYQDSSRMSRYNRYRSPLGHGEFFPDHVFDQLPYIDTLLQDLGMSPWRKPNILREMFEPYSVTDYQNIAQEWLAKST